MLKFKDVVRTLDGLGVIVSIGKAHYGVEFTAGEVIYYPHDAVSPANG